MESVDTCVQKLKTTRTEYFWVAECFWGSEYFWVNWTLSFDLLNSWALMDMRVNKYTRTAYELMDMLGLVMIVNGTLVYGTFHKILLLRHFCVWFESKVKDKTCHLPKPRLWIVTICLGIIVVGGGRLWLAYTLTRLIVIRSHDTGSVATCSLPMKFKIDITARFDPLRSGLHWESLNTPRIVCSHQSRFCIVFVSTS